MFEHEHPTANDDYHRLKDHFTLQFYLAERELENPSDRFTNQLQLRPSELQPYQRSQHPHEGDAAKATKFAAKQYQLGLMNAFNDLNRLTPTALSDLSDLRPDENPSLPLTAQQRLQTSKHFQSLLDVIEGHETTSSAPQNPEYTLKSTGTR